MSQRPYITVNGQKVYSWTDVHSEFTCDVCLEVIEPKAPQVHLTADGTLFGPMGPPARIKGFPLDIHIGCVPELLSKRIRCAVEADK